MPCSLLHLLPLSPVGNSHGGRALSNPADRVREKVACPFFSRCAIGCPLTTFKLHPSVSFYLCMVRDAYWINRQRVLMAINRAVKKHNVEFAKLYRVEAGQQPVWRVFLPANEPHQTISPDPVLLSSSSSSPSSFSDGRVVPSSN
jgi:hypothetical protein